MKRFGKSRGSTPGLATSAKGGEGGTRADLASYPLGQVPTRPPAIVRALLTPIANQRFAAHA